MQEIPPQCSDRQARLSDVHCSHADGPLYNGITLSNKMSLATFMSQPHLKTTIVQHITQLDVWQLSGRIVTQATCHAFIT